MSSRKSRKEGRENKEKVDYKKAFKIFSFIKPYRFTFFIGFIFLILSSLSAMAFPYLIGLLFDAKDPSGTAFQINDWDPMLSIVMVLFSVFAAQAVFSFFRIVLFARVTEYSLKDLREASFKHLIHLPIDFYDQNKVGELTSRMATDINLLQETFNVTLAEFFRQFITVFIGIIALFYFSPQLALTMLAIVPALALFAVFFGRFIKKLSKSSQDEAAQSNIVLEESLSGIAVVKAFTNEWKEMKRYGQAIVQVKNLSIKGAIWRAAFVSFIIFTLFAAIVFILYRGMEILETGELMSFLLYTVFLGASIGSIPELWAKIQKAMGATEKLMDLFQIDNEWTDDSISELRLKGDIEFNNVSFSYASRKEVPVLTSLNFKVRAGENIALVGESGAGKSTITSLLLQYYKQDAGQILFDGKESSAYSLKDIRSQMAIVPQEVFLFGGTIAENIRYGKEGATDEEIIEAAKNANAWDFISKFPDGLDTMVGDRGVQLSGGQKQRVAIARAMINNPPILILDEATSNLDSLSEKLVQEALERLMEGRTSIVIAHRLSTVQHADRILVLKEGNIIEEGSHQDLLQQEGIYAELTKIQFS